LAWRKPSIGGSPSGQVLPAASKRRAVGAPSWCQAPLASVCARLRTCSMWPPSAWYSSSRMLNSIGATMAGVGTVPKLWSGMRATSTITVMPPPGHT